MAGGVSPGRPVAAQLAARYVGEWVDGMKEGQGTETFSDGTKYCGLWRPPPHPRAVAPRALGTGLSPVGRMPRQRVGQRADAVRAKGVVGTEGELGRFSDLVPLLARTHTHHAHKHMPGRAMIICNCRADLSESFPPSVLLLPTPPLPLPCLRPCRARRQLPPRPPPRLWDAVPHTARPATRSSCRRSAARGPRRVAMGRAARGRRRDQLCVDGRGACRRR